MACASGAVPPACRNPVCFRAVCMPYAQKSIKIQCRGPEFPNGGSVIVPCELKCRISPVPAGIGGVCGRRSAARVTELHVRPRNMHALCPKIHQVPMLLRGHWCKYPRFCANQNQRSGKGAPRGPAPPVSYAGRCCPRAAPSCTHRISAGNYRPCHWCLQCGPDGTPPKALNFNN